MTQAYFFTAEAQRRKGNAKENKDGKVIRFVTASPETQEGNRESLFR